MRLMLRPELRPRPLRSVLGFMDIKTGVILATLFALFNKVAGVYGLIAIFHGGSFAQLSMYLYSVGALGAFLWGLKVVTAEDPRRTLYFAHLFVADHLLNTIWFLFFAVAWWVYNPHDGKRIANSEAQKEMMGASGGAQMTEEERRLAAQLIWNQEKGLAAVFLTLGWLCKIYFAILLYSYASHLRKGSYHSLPLSRSIDEAEAEDDTRPFHSTSALSGPRNPADEYELDEEQSFPASSPLTSSSAAPFLPRGGSRHHPTPSARILHDLETPVESVLWDDEDDLGDHEVATTSSSAVGGVGKGVRSDTTVSDGELERESELGDLGGMVGKEGELSGRGRIS